MMNKSEKKVKHFPIIIFIIWFIVVFFIVRTILLQYEMNFTNLRWHTYKDHMTFNVLELFGMDDNTTEYNLGRDDYIQSKLREDPKDSDENTKETLVPTQKSSEELMSQLDQKFSSADTDLSKTKEKTSTVKNTKLISEKSKNRTETNNKSSSEVKENSSKQTKKEKTNKNKK